MAAVAVEGYRKEDTFAKSFRRKERVKNTIGTPPFDSSQARKAIKLASKFMNVAKQNPNHAVDKVIEAINESKGTDLEVVRWALLFFISNNPGLARWALMIYVSNHLAAHQNDLRIPSLVNRAPEVSIPEKQPFTAPDPGKQDAPPAHREDVETLIDKDPNFNEHHDVVHSSSGVPDPNNLDDDTQHEKLFTDMHQQMLARLDVEHQVLGLPPLENLRNPDESRAPNQKLKFLDGTEIAPDLLGSAIKSFGTNNDDHVMLACMRDQGLFGTNLQPAVETDPPHNDPGLMHNPRVSERDRKRNRHVDDLHNKWQETPSPHDLSDAPPPVNIREGDIILNKLTQQETENDPQPRPVERDRKQYRHVDDCYDKWQETPSPHDFSDTPPPVNIRGDIILDKLHITTHGTTRGLSTKEFSEKGNNFNMSSDGIVTHEVQTKMKHKKWTLIEEGSGATVDLEHLFSRKYYYFRVENTSPSQLDATFRVFLAPKELTDSRHHWIKIDKFKQTLSVLCRDRDMSSIARQLLQKIDELEMEREFITNWSDSRSFCSPEKLYSDPGPTGYPFDNPFKNNPYEETFIKGLNWTTEDRFREAQLAANYCTNKSLCK